MSFFFDLTKSLAARAGVFVSWNPPPQSFQRHLRDFLAQMEINCVLDVGAFKGTYAQEVRRAGFQGRIISFEPVPESFAQLQRTMKGDQNWTGVQVGLSNMSGPAEIHTFAKGNFNSLLDLKKDARDAYEVRDAGKIKIDLRRLDEILAPLLAVEQISPPRIFLKMDTQGNDLNVFKGAAGVLDRIIGLQSELAVMQLYDGMPSMVDSMNYYHDYGFVPVGFYPINTVDVFRVRRVTPEFDVLFNRIRQE